jgi:hypothetical protein
MLNTTFKDYLYDGELHDPLQPEELQEMIQLACYWNMTKLHLLLQDSLIDLIGPETYDECQYMVLRARHHDFRC